MSVCCLGCDNFCISNGSYGVYFCCFYGFVYVLVGSCEVCKVCEVGVFDICVLWLECCKCVLGCGV